MSRGLFLSLTLLVIMGAPDLPAQNLSSPHPAYIPVERFDPARDAEKDIRDAVAEAQRSSRRVLLDVGGDWCIWCRRLDSLFASRDDLRKLRDAGFVTVKVNWSKENKNERLLSHYPPVPGYPHLFVLNQEGKLLHSQDTSELEKGKGHDPDKVMAFLKRWGGR